MFKESRSFRLELWRQREGKGKASCRERGCRGRDKGPLEQHLKAEFLNVRTIAPTSGALYLWMKGLTFSLTRETPAGERVWIVQ